MNIAVIIPTYNEIGSIERLLDALEQELAKIPWHQFNIVVVDGNSPDGTGEAVRGKSEIHKNIYLIEERGKRGLGIAYITGIKHAVYNLGADAFIEFDGDFQHDPKDMPRLVRELDKGYDYVIGSRYVLGGEIPKDWGWHRKLLSSFGSLVIKFLLNLPTKDNTSGLKLSRVKGFVEYLPLEEDLILSKHYAYKIQFLYEMIRHGARVKEIPIKFLPRYVGESKSTLKDIIESLRVVILLRLKK